MVDPTFSVYSSQNNIDFVTKISLMILMSNNKENLT